jgi:hypothetical protein
MCFEIYTDSCYQFNHMIHIIILLKKYILDNLYLYSKFTELCAFNNFKKAYMIFTTSW